MMCTPTGMEGFLADQIILPTGVVDPIVHVEIARNRGAGYKVDGLWRGSGPYPPSARKPL